MHPRETMNGRTNDAHHQLVIYLVDANHQRVVHDVDVSKEFAVVV